MIMDGTPARGFTALSAIESLSSNGTDWAGVGRIVCAERKLENRCDRKNRSIPENRLVNGGTSRYLLPNYRPR
jgi:hypothetical protein